MFREPPPARVLPHLVITEALERRALLAATALSDFSAPASRGIGEAFTLGGASYYAFNDGFRGYELWRSDAAHPQGRLVRDVNTVSYDASGRTGSSHPTSFFSVNGVALFVADDGISGRELWRTDGSSAGTHRLIESKIGYDGIEPGAPLAHAPFKSGMMIFTSPDMIYTDGSAAGTRRLARSAPEVFQAPGRLYWLEPTARRGVLAFDGTTLSTAFALSGSGRRARVLRRARPRGLRDGRHERRAAPHPRAVVHRRPAGHGRRARVLHAGDRRRPPP
jgi:ELWxxDGT repeat protein